jgi:hypothetical protein
MAVCTREQRCGGAFAALAGHVDQHARRRRTQQPGLPVVRLEADLARQPNGIQESRLARPIDLSPWPLPPQAEAVLFFLSSCRTGRYLALDMDLFNWKSGCTRTDVIAVSLQVLSETERVKRATPPAWCSLRAARSPAVRLLVKSAS